MRKINELASLTGVTTCALRYYDKIGLLKPAEISESGYRLYDDKALETLQQILFFRELDVPLKQIKAILEIPNFDRLSMLKKHKKLITLKRDRLNNILALIEKNLKGEHYMSFTEFEMKSIETAFRESIETVTDAKFWDFIKEKFSSKEDMIEKSLKAIQTQPEMIYSYFGSVDGYVKALKKEADKEKLAEIKKNCDEIYLKISQNQDKSASDETVQKLVDDLQKLHESFYETTTTGMIKDLSTTLLCDVDAMKTEISSTLVEKDIDEAVRKAEANCAKLIDHFDGKFGKGSARFIGEAIKFYLTQR